MSTPIDKKSIKIGSWNVNSLRTPQQTIEHYERTKQKFNTLRTNGYIEQIGNRIQSDPYTMNEFEVVETAFFLKLHASDKMSRKFMEFNYAMNQCLKKPGAAARIMNQLNTKIGVPPGYTYISNIHDPMFTHLEKVASGKSGGRKTRRQISRKHKKRTRSRK